MENPNHWFSFVRGGSKWSKCILYSSNFYSLTFPSWEVNQNDQSPSHIVPKPCLFDLFSISLISENDLLIKIPGKTHEDLIFMSRMRGIRLDRKNTYTKRTKWNYSTAAKTHSFLSPEGVRLIQQAAMIKDLVPLHLTLCHQGFTLPMRSEGTSSFAFGTAVHTFYSI